MEEYINNNTHNEIRWINGIKKESLFAVFNCVEGHVVEGLWLELLCGLGTSSLCVLVFCFCGRGRPLLSATSC